MSRHITILAIAGALTALQSAMDVSFAADNEPDPPRPRRTAESPLEGRRIVPGGDAAPRTPPPGRYPWEMWIPRPEDIQRLLDPDHVGPGFEGQEYEEGAIDAPPPPPPVPSQAQLTVMSDEQLRHLIRKSAAKLDEDLDGFRTGATWKKYLDLKTLTSAMAGKKQATLDDNVLAQLKEAGDRFEETSRQKKFGQINSLPSFRTLHAALREHALDDGERGRKQAALGAKALKQSLQRLNTGKGWDAYLQLQKMQEITAVKKGSLDDKSRKEATEILKRLKEVQGKKAYASVAKQPGFQLALKGMSAYVAHDRAVDQSAEGKKASLGEDADQIMKLKKPSVGKGPDQVMQLEKPSTGKDAGQIMQLKKPSFGKDADQVMQLKELSPEDTAALKEIVQQIKASKQQQAKERWKQLVQKTVDRGGDAQEVQSLIKAVLRDASADTRQDLAGHEGKSAHFRQLQKELRQHLAELRSIAQELDASSRVTVETVGKVSPYRPGRKPYIIWKRQTFNADELRDQIEVIEAMLKKVDGQARMADIDLENTLQKQQQQTQAMANTMKMLHDTAQSVIRKID